MEFTGTVIPYATEESISVNSKAMSTYSTTIVDSGKVISDTEELLQQQSETYCATYEGASSEKYKLAQEVLHMRITNLHKQLSMLSLTLNAYTAGNVSINTNADRNAAGGITKSIN